MIAMKHSTIPALLLAASLAFADGGVQPKPLFEPTLSGAAAQLRPNANCDAQLTTEFDGDAMLLTIALGESPWPGVFILPAGGAPSWDLSLWGHVEAKITNLGATQVALTLRVDNASIPGQNPWNAEMARINPGQSTTVRTYFGYSWGFQRGYALDTSAVIRLLLYLGKVEGEPVKLRIEGVQAAGWQGERPGANPDQARVKPRVAAPVPVALPVGDANPKPVVALRPHAGGFWDLSDAIQAVVRVRNTGAAPVSPRLRLTSVDGPTEWCAPAAPVAPGAEADIRIPFAGARPWTAPTDPLQLETLHGGGWDRMPGTGTAFRAHKARAVEALPGDAPQSFEIVAFRGEDPPARRPAWLGTRPPVAGDWTPTLRADFDGDALDLSTFSVRWFNWWDKRQHDSADNVFLRDGKLVLRAEKKTGFHNDEPDPARLMPGSLIKDRSHETPYAVGWADTFGKWTQRYGYFEARLKLPTAPNLWPALWLCPDRGLPRHPRGLPALDWNQFKARTDTFGTGMEIDWVEAQSSWGPHRFNASCHWDGYGKEHKKLGTNANYIPADPDGFITVGMLWLPGHLSFWGNGEKFWQWESPRIMNEPAFLELQNQIGGWDNDPIDDALLPADFEIDYIRVWQRRDLASPDDGPKPNEGGLDGRVGPGLPGPAREDPRDDVVREAHRRVEAAANGAPGASSAPIAPVLINDPSPIPPPPAAVEGDAPRVLRWQDGRKAAFCLSFDDGCNSHLDHVVPLLRQYGAVGTFYPICERGHFPWRRKEWEAFATDPAVDLGNHTFRHVGAEDAAQLETELQGAQEIIRALTPDAPWPRLVSFGQPGGVPWKVSREEVADALQRHHLVDRAPFWGAGIHVKTVADAEKLVDEAIAKGNVGHLDFHGVGGDWLSVPTDFLEGLLRHIAERRDEVWQTSAIDAHKYAVERDAATLETLSATPARVTLRLSCAADPALYDLPLTIEAPVPASWTRCSVRAEGRDPVEAPVVQGRVRFYAQPGVIELASGAR